MDEPGAAIPDGRYRNTDSDGKSQRHYEYTHSNEE